MRFYSLLSVAALAAVCFGQDNPKNMTFSTKLKSVSVFRDGFGYFVREGKVKLEDGWATTNVAPTAVKGTIRFYTLDKGDQIDEVIIAKENRLEFSNTKDLKAKLADKIGLKLTVVTKTDQRFDGELAKILDDMLLLKAGDAYNGIPFDQVKTIILPGYPVRIKVTTDKPNKVLTIGVAYLQDGIRWEPSYVLDFHGGQGNLSLRASMQNTTEKLENSDVYFVVGSPFVANRGIVDMLAPAISPAPNAPIEAKSDKDRAPQIRAEAAEQADAAMHADGAGKLNATVAHDEAGELYYYHKPGLSLDNNDFAMVSVFENSVPVTPRFEWNADGEEVSYLLDILNRSNQPLTTGPVFVLENGKAIGQENVKYTPAGGSTEIRLSQGIGLKVEKVEAEVRRGAPAHVGRTDYIPVVLKGTLTITNFRSVKAAVKVTRTARGKVDSQSDGGKIKQTQILSGEPNPINDLEWNIDVAPNSTRTITYTFETYMSAERAGSPPVPVSGDGD
jgi:hypothetical protein